MVKLLSSHLDIGNKLESFNVDLDLVARDQRGPRLGLIGVILDLNALDPLRVPFGVGGEVEELAQGVSGLHGDHCRFDAGQTRTISRTFAGGASISILLSRYGIVSGVERVLGIMGIRQEGKG